MADRTFTIGRAADCDLVLAGDGVSRQHARLTVLEDGGLLVTDAASTMGTSRMDGHREVPIDSATVSRDDVLRLGDVDMSVAQIVEALRQKHPAFGWPATPEVVPVPSDERPTAPVVAGETVPAAYGLECPVCGRSTQSLKRFKLFQWLVFLLVFYWVRTAVYTACPDCMRKALLKRTLANVIPGNLAWLLVVLPLHTLDFCRTFAPGPSKGAIADDPR